MEQINGMVRNYPLPPVCNWYCLNGQITFPACSGLEGLALPWRSCVAHLLVPAEHPPDASYTIRFYVDDSDETVKQKIDRAIKAFNLNGFLKY
jgi:hypothetical protein